MSFVDEKYISYASVYLRNFHRKGDVYNFSCHVCGDSQYDKRKARGYLIESENQWFYKCHNCGINYNFKYFLKSVDESIYKNYCLESFQTTNQKKQKPKTDHNVHKLFETKKTLTIDNIFLGLEYLEKNHPAIDYCVKRNIPKEYYNSWYYSDNLNLMNKVFEKYKDTKFLESDPRIIIPLYEKEKLIAIVARSLTANAKMKYIIMKSDENVKLFYKKKEIDRTKPIYVVEGPIDSLFIDNSIAVLGSDLKKCVEEYPNAIYIFDNQPRNKEILKIMSNLLDKVKMVIWPENLKEKDINEMICNSKDVQNIIDNNIYSGLQLKLNFAKWRKI